MDQAEIRPEGETRPDLPRRPTLTTTMTTDPNSQNNARAEDGASPIEAQRPAMVPFRVIGVGNAGVNVVGQMIAAGLDPAACAVVNVEPSSVAASPASRKVVLESSLLRGLGTGGDPERGRAIAKENAAALQALCDGVGVAFVVAGMGGGTGTGIAPELVRQAKTAGAMVLAFGILPFECEGSLRNQMALEGCHELRAVADLLVSLPN